VLEAVTDDHAEAIFFQKWAGTTSKDYVIFAAQPFQRHFPAAFTQNAPTASIWSNR
jgi:hypothetical protein